MNIDNTAFEAAKKQAEDSAAKAFGTNQGEQAIALAIVAFAQAVNNVARALARR